MSQHVAQHVVVLSTLFLPRGPLSTTKSWLNFDKYFTKVPLSKSALSNVFVPIRQTLFIEALLNKTIQNNQKISQKLHPHLLEENDVYFALFYSNV